MKTSKTSLSFIVFISVVCFLLSPTLSVAKIYHLPKGTIEEQVDADVIVLDLEKSSLQYVFARGQLVKTPTWIEKGMFEPYRL